MTYDDDIDIDWQDGAPPERVWNNKASGDLAYPYHHLAAAVRSRRPGWVMVHDMPSVRGFISKYHAGYLAAIRPDEGFEVARRGRAVALRYLGGGPDVPNPEALEADARPMKLSYPQDDEIPQITRVQRSELHARVARELQSRPGQWAILVGADDDWQPIITTAAHRSYRPARSFEAVIRNGEAWARYVGDGDSGYNAGADGE